MRISIDKYQLQSVINYPASRGFALAWLLAFTESFVSLVIGVGGLNKPTT